MKNRITQKFINANTTDEYDSLSDIVDCRLTWLVRDIGNFKHKVVAKEFASTQQAESLINDIKLRIDSNMEKIS